MRAVEAWATTRRGRIAAGILGAAMALYLGAQMHNKVLQAGRTHGTDYECHLIGGRAVLAGRDVSTVLTRAEWRPFAFLPWFGVVMVPFVLMGYQAASFVFPLLNLLGVAASSYWCLKAVRGADAPVPWPLWVLPPLLICHPLENNFGLAQMNVLSLVLISLGLYLYVRRRDAGAGLSLAAATLLKGTPGLLVAYFAWKREWRLVSWACVGALLLAFVVPMPIYGVREGAASARVWLDRRVVRGASAPEADGYIAGESLRTIVTRLLTDSAATTHPVAGLRVNVASLSPKTAEAIYLTAAAMILGVLALATRGRGNRQNVACTALEIALVITVMLVVTPHDRKAHFVQFMFPMVYAYSHLALAEAWTRRDRVLLGATVACFVLMTFTGSGLVGTLAAAYLDALSAMAWGAIALLVGLVAVRERVRSEPAPRLPRGALAFLCLGVGAALLASSGAWFVFTAGTPPGIVPPAGQALPGAAPFRFAVLGDSRGRMGLFAKVLARIKAEPVALIIHTGDLAWRPAEREFSWVLSRLNAEKLSVPFCPCPGNHDIQRDGGDIETSYRLYTGAFGPRHYWFSYANALFVAVDTATGRCSREELEWLDHTLTLRRGGYAACFVFTHYPPRDPRPGCSHALAEGGQPLMALLAKHRVTALFAGHIHGYLEDRLAGVPIFISGGAGAPLDHRFPTEPKHHYLLCAAEANGTLECRKVEIDGVRDTSLLAYWVWAKYPAPAAALGGAVCVAVGAALLRRRRRGACAGIAQSETARPH